MLASHSAAPDLMILDVLMEDVDSGLKAFDRVSTEYPTIPIILFTSLDAMVLPHFEKNNGKGWIRENRCHQIAFWPW